MRWTVFLFFLISSALWAQLDPSTSIFLQKGVSQSPEESGLDSGRYQNRNRRNQTAPRGYPRSTPRPQGSYRPAYIPQASPTPRDDGAIVGPFPPTRDEATTDFVGEDANKNTLAPQGAPGRSPLKGVATPPFLEFAVAPYAFSTRQKSPSWYRAGKNSGLGLGGEIKFWPQENWAVGGSFRRSFATSALDSLTTPTYTGVDYLDWTAGAFVRPAPTFELGLHYFETQQDFAAYARNRTGSRRFGLELSATTQIPMPSSTIDFAIKLRPWAQEKETPAAANVNSGTHEQSVGATLTAGQTFNLSDRHNVFYRIGGSFDQSRYRGLTNAVDPVTQQTVQNNKVEHTTYWFELGISWK